MMVQLEQTFYGLFANDNFYFDQNYMYNTTFNCIEKRFHENRGVIAARCVFLSSNRQSQRAIP